MSEDMMMGIWKRQTDVGNVWLNRGKVKTLQWLLPQGITLEYAYQDQNDKKEGSTTKSTFQ